MYTLGTNAIIYYLKDDPDAVIVLSSIFTQNIPLYISAITEIELFSFPKLSVQEEEQIDEVLRTVAIIPVDSRIAGMQGLFAVPIISILPIAPLLLLPFLQEPLSLLATPGISGKSLIFLCVRSNFPGFRSNTDLMNKGLKTNPSRPPL